jgi:peptide deformylase
MLITVKTKNKNLLYEAIEAQSMNDEQIKEIGTKLANGLKRYGGIGLSANQIGEDWRVCLIDLSVLNNPKDEENSTKFQPLLLVNPKIINASTEKVLYKESCLSIPKSLKKPVNTIRSTSITVSTDNLGELVFSADKTNWENTKEFYNDAGLLQSVVVQHEIDHLDGILITSPQRRYNLTVTNNRKFGRNEMVFVKNEESGDTSFVKYKVAQRLETQGYSII